MRVAVVYESMFGSTRLVAEAITRGLSAQADVRVVGVADAANVLDGCDLVVVGGPTHAWSMPWPSTRRGAILRVNKPGSDLVLEPGAQLGPGIREWLASLGRVVTRAAAFDTRIKGPVLLTGRASKSIGRHLARHGFTVVTPPESFFVDKGSHLLQGELERAQAWGAALVGVCRGDPNRQSLDPSIRAEISPPSGSSTAS